MAKTYLVTGAAGFIGSRFVESCAKRGISVISVDRLSHFIERPEMTGLDFGRIVDRDNLFSGEFSSESANLAPNFQSDLKIDAIVHLGAITDTRESDFQKLNRQNVEYSQQIWRWASDLRIPLAYASSAATYGNGDWGYNDDEGTLTQLRQLNLYGESKQRFDLWALEQEKRGFCPPSWSGFKFFNVYGPGESHKGFMSSVVLHAYRQIQESGAVKLFKSHRAGIPDGFQKRDFISVEDVVEVLHFSLDRPLRRGIFNLGTGNGRTFLDLAQAVFSALGKKPEIRFIDTPLSIRDKYQYFTEAQMEKLRGQGYEKPFLSLEEGVSRYIRYLVG